MKKTLLRLILSALFVTYITSANAQDVDKDILNWYNSKKTGISTDKAYKKLKRITPDTVIVAIIDAGIDIEHEDLQGHIWTNKGEIPNNGKDDDGNGYVDDVHGWNFLGNKNGENQAHARLNFARIFAQLKPKYDGVDSADVLDVDREEYNLYLETKKEIADSRKEYEGYISQVKQFKTMLPNIPTMVAKMMEIEEDELTEENVKEWEPEGPQQKQMKRFELSILSGELSEEKLDKQIESIQGRLDYHFNPDFNGRTVVGDDPYDVNDTDYGNNDVAGPDPLHGTHVGGIVSAIRGNDLGGDGVANNVLLMSLRAVPDGDEFDKDVAAAIRYAVDNGAKVINGSFGKGYSSLPKEVYNAIIYAEENDVLFVQAAGNDAEDLAKNQSYPSTMYDFQKEPFTHMITVGASTRDHKGKLAAPFSNYGTDQVDVFAPGAEIYNAVPDNKYRALQGTSMASPMVAGLAALLKGYFPELTMEEVREVIVESGDDFGDTEQTLPGTDEEVKFSTLSKTGKVVNVKSAVKMAKKMEKAKKKKLKANK